MQVLDKRVVNAVEKVVRNVLEGRIKSATKYLEPKLVVRASRRLFKGKIVKGNVEIVLTIGRPNYEERDFIKDCQKAKEPFPIKGVMLKFPSKSKTNKRK